MGLQQITGNEIAAGSIAATDLASASITGDKLGLTAINANNIVGGTITTTQIASNTISNTNIQTGAVENYLRSQTLDFGMRNRIINGAMRIDQRNVGASATPSNGQYTLDRWQQQMSASAKFSVQQDSSANTVAGFTSSLKVTSLSAYSVSSTDYFDITQNIEGFNAADLNWGTANAKPVTLSFWVRSSLTGTFGGSLMNGDYDRSNPYTYTISAVDTWEYKTVTVAGDVTGTWLKTTGAGMQVNFSLGAGATRSGTAGTWAGSQLWSATGATSVVGTNGATFYITGVQLEVGSTATSFDYRPYGTELALCQRYYQKTYDVNTVPGSTFNWEYASPAFAIGTGNFGMPCGRSFLVSMRATPTITTYDGSGNAGKIAQWGVGENQSYGSVGATQNQITAFDFSNNTTAGRSYPFAFVASAEL